MLTLRWILGLIALVLGGGCSVLVIVSNGFRRSFGASENNPLLMILPFVAMGLLFTSLIWPSHRWLLHAAALAAVGLAGFCVWQMVSEAATSLGFAIVYLLAWFVFYWHSAWQSSSVPSLDA